MQGVRTTQGDFFAPIVVDAAGAWAAQVAEMAGVQVPVTTWRHDTMFIKRPAKLHLPHPTVIDDANSMYFRPESGGLTLVGLEDGNPLGLSPEGNTDSSQPGFVERAIERICRRIPAMEGGALHSSHGGFDGLLLRPARHPGSGWTGWLLPGLRLQRDRLQDRTCCRRLHGGMDTGRGASDRRYHPLQT